MDLAAQYADENPDILACVEDVFTKGEFVGGAIIGELETAISETVGAGHTVALNSGTDALILTLLAMDIGPGDEVITAPNSFVATAGTIAATPVFADVRADLNIDPAGAVDTAQFAAANGATAGKARLHGLDKGAPSINTQVNIVMSDLELARRAAYLLENGVDALEP